MDDAPEADGPPESAPSPSGDTVDIHKPHPWHGWREFLKEYGIIVLGVLTALSLEQAVEALHWRHKVDETERQLRAELKVDLVTAYLWLAASDCEEARLGPIEKALREARSSGRYPEKVAPYKPALVLWTSDAWLNARAMQVADHLPEKAFQNYLLAYFYPPELQGGLIKVHDLSAELGPLDGGLDKLTPAEADEFLGIVARVKKDVDTLNLGSVRFTQAAANAGVSLSPDDKKQALDYLRRVGGCVGSAEHLSSTFSAPLNLGGT
jgi:hypothetical protein